ncbi:hypothetical protein D3C76_1821140 [compost metagenome]
MLPPENPLITGIDTPFCGDIEVNAHVMGLAIYRADGKLHIRGRPGQELQIIHQQRCSKHHLQADPCGFIAIGTG